MNSGKSTLGEYIETKLKKMPLIENILFLFNYLFLDLCLLFINLVNFKVIKQFKLAGCYWVNFERKQILNCLIAQVFNYYVIVLC